MLPPLFPRHASRKNQPTTSSAAATWTCVKPSARSTHSTRRSGESDRLPSTHAARTANVRIVQKRTAGPRNGPFAHRIHRLSGTPMAVVMFALSTGSFTRPARANVPIGSLVRHSTLTA